MITRYLVLPTGELERLAEADEFDSVVFYETEVAAKVAVNMIRNYSPVSVFKVVEIERRPRALR